MIKQYEQQNIRQKKQQRTIEKKILLKKFNVTESKLK